VESLALAVERLRDAVGIEPSFQAVGVDERAFLDALPQQALNAYEDQCAPANPRMPMLDDMSRLMRAAYYGPGGTTGTHGTHGTHSKKGKNGKNERSA
jgi:acetaldehyde dehydrogenase/alcohol dehydrogenase